MAELRKAGKRGTVHESHEPRLMASLFVADAQSGFLEWSCTKGIAENDWGMLGNDRWGDCGLAMCAHGDVAKMGDVTVGNSFGFPTFPNTLDTYFAYGLAQGEVGQPPDAPNQPDFGVENATLFGWLYKLGIIYGYAEVPLDSIDWYGMTFNGVCLGQLLDDDAEQEFEADPRIPWGSGKDKPDPRDGHDTLGVSGDGQGNGTLITWGGEQPYVVNYRNSNITDAWVMFDEDDPFVNHAALQAALEAVHGTVNA